MDATDGMTFEVTGTVELPGGEPAEVGVWRPTPDESDDPTPRVVARIPEWPMPPEVAERLADTLRQAADRARRLRA